MATDQEQALQLIVEALDRVGVSYLVGGSVASSIHGIPRMTQDVDIVAALDQEHVGPFVAAIRDAFYVDEAAVRDAVVRRECFNVIHLESVAKVDVFVRDASAWARSQWDRRIRSKVTDSSDSPEVNVASAEDTVLHKLLWYRKGAHVSDRHWTDVLGILRVRGYALNRTYLDVWAESLGVRDLLQRALRESEIVNSGNGGSETC